MSLSETSRPKETAITARELMAWVRDSRERAFELAADLNDDQLMGPRLAIVNPMRWEIGHTAWFQEKWVLRHVCREKPIRDDADALYDSIAIPHDTRWDLPLPPREETLRYMREVRDRVLEKLEQPEPSPALLYFAAYCVFHDDMHNEAFTYTRQTLGYPAPRISLKSAQPDGTIAQRFSLPGDAEIPGGTILLGASPDETFVFDNEKWAHAVEVKPFAMARAAVSQVEFLAFVEEGGYSRQELWSADGWKWREAAQAQHPVYWRREASGRWLRRHYDRWVPLEPERPVIHVNWYEADAYCRWAGRRLPAEAEWEAAAALEPSPDRSKLSPDKRRYAWGNEPPAPERANLDWQAGGCVEAGALPKGESAFGCRQMIGNVWEWTSTPFAPYPGFVADPYKEYSEPWFHTHNVLRGGCWATRSRMIRNTYRNFYKPDRRDVFAGFRTCRLAE